MGKVKRQRAIYILGDFLSSSLAWCIFNLIRYFTLPMNYASMSLKAYMSMSTVLLGQLLFPLMMVLLYAVSGYYNRVFFKSRLDDLLNAAGVSAIGSVIIFFTALFNDQIDDRLGNIEMIVILWLLFTCGTSLVRIIITSWAASKISARQIAFRTIIVGGGSKGRQLASDLDTKYRNMGFQVIGFAAAEDQSDPGCITLEQAIYDASNNRVDRFIIVPNQGDDISKTVATVNALLPTGKPVYLTPDTYSFIASRPRTAMVAGQVLIDVSHANIPSSTLNLKRIADVVCSAVALIALSPVYALLALLVKQDSKGPVFYKQERVGYKKKPFYIYKFRTMREDAEADGPALSSVTDPRVTKVGRVLRKYRLDELPQFWNVLRGDMSLVGPRPERKYYLEQIIAKAPYYNIIHQVRPGITSWGMVKYGYASSVEEMVQRMQYDLIYVDNLSMAVDLKILFYTIRTVITGKGV